MPEAWQAPSDAELIEGWRRGDEEAAAQLVRRHTPAVARFLSAAGAREDLDDLVQEAFFRAFRKIDSFRGSASFRTWLMAIGSNALKDLRRRERRRDVISLEDRDPPDESTGPHDSVVKWDLVAHLELAVKQLPPMQRDVFLLRAQQGLDYEAIAEVLETSVGAARVNYHHAVKRLKAVLGR